MTGASTGIGRSCVARLAEGYRVFAGVRRAEDGEDVRSLKPDSIVPVILDVTDADSIDAAAKLVQAEGGGQLAGLVNNAGTGIPGPLESIDLADFREQLEVNVIGQLAMTQAFLEQLRAGEGRVIFVGSIGGKVSFPYAGPYITSKHAIEGLADVLRQELRESNVEVALIEPGPIDTPIWTKAAERARRLAGRLDRRQSERYGSQLDAFADRLEKVPERSASPDRVAAAVERALTRRRPHSRYPVGIGARLLYRVRPLIPDRVYDAAVTRL